MQLYRSVWLLLHTHTEWDKCPCPLVTSLLPSTSSLQDWPR